MPNVFVPEIFISYRHDDEPELVKRIYDELCKEFSKDEVFLDTEALEAGFGDIGEQVNFAINSCSILLVMIGPKWYKIGKKRLKSSSDPVRVEIETGLRRNNVFVLPILLNGAKLSEQKLREIKAPKSVRMLSMKWAAR